MLPELFKGNSFYPSNTKRKAGRGSTTHQRNPRVRWRLCLFSCHQKFSPRISQERNKVFHPRRSSALLSMRNRVRMVEPSWSSQAPSVGRSEATSSHSIREMVQLQHAWGNKEREKSDHTRGVLWGNLWSNHGLWQTWVWKTRFLRILTLVY